MTIDMIVASTGSALYSDLDTSTFNGNVHEDERALQIALELSNLGLLGINDDDPANYDDVTKGKKSQNMTECVPVPSSEHVAEIVGRQGCKIKALRAKTNTYIKTPVRGEDPVFVVTGRKEDVAMARREVQSAAEHFTQIRASRNRHALLASQALGALNADGSAGTITLQVRVPYRVVGLVVGPKGATIKRIQQQTHTYIVTPSRDKEPVFEVTGLPENVEKAKEEIEAHIASRTGTQQTSIDDDFRNNGTDVDGPCAHSEYAKNTSQSLASAFVPSNNINTSVLRPAASSFFPLSVSNQAYSAVTSSQRNPMLAPATSSAELLSLGERQFQPSNVLNHTVSGAYSGLDTRKNNLTWNIGVNNNFEIPTSSTIPSYLSISTNDSCLNPSLAASQQNRLSPTLSDKDFSFSNLLLPPSTQSLHLPVRRVASEESTTSSAPSSEFGCLLTPTSSYSSAVTPAVNIESGYSSSGTADSITSGSPDSALGHLQFSRDCLPSKPQRCVMCTENPVSAALVPCGHHLFCYSCAEDVVSKKPSLCPCCSVNASRALLIKQ